MELRKAIIKKQANAGQNIPVLFHKFVTDADGDVIAIVENEKGDVLTVCISELQFNTNPLKDELSKRPFKIKSSCSLVKYPKNITKAVKELTDKLNKGEEFYVNANYKNIAVLTLRPFKADEQIFYGLVVAVENECDINVFDFVEFQVCDLFDM